MSFCLWVVSPIVFIGDRQIAGWIEEGRKEGRKEGRMKEGRKGKEGIRYIDEWWSTFLKCLMVKLFNEQPFVVYNNVLYANCRVIAG